LSYVIAEASLLKFVLRLHQALASWEHQATIRRQLTCPVRRQLS
jgi:hypothetical protein